jgi:type IX secretion system PorP/SprF family membrane protein
MKRFLTILLFVSAAVSASFAQQQAMFTQYMFNPIAINPAYAGSLEAWTATAIARTQWTSMPGAPQTQTASVHGPVKYSRASFGAQIIHDQITVSHHYGVYGFYSYYIPLNKKTKLSFGVRGGVSNYRADLSELEVFYPGMDIVQDPSFASDQYGGWLPNVGLGVYIRNNRWYAGFSVPEIIHNTITTSVESIKGKQERHYFIHGGYVFDLSPDLKIKPNFLVKGVEGAPVQVDLNANLLIKDIVWIGGSYRWDESFAAILEIDFNRQFRLGYSYDFAGRNNLGPFNNGSHEFLISYRFIRDKGVTITPRYF